jgi:hypothetical protein
MRLWGVATGEWLASQRPCSTLRRCLLLVPCCSRGAVVVVVDLAPLLPCAGEVPAGPHQGRREGRQPGHRRYGRRACLPSPCLLPPTPTPRPHLPSVHSHLACFLPVARVCVLPVTIEREPTKVTVAAQEPFSKRYLKVRPLLSARQAPVPPPPHRGVVKPPCCRLPLTNTACPALNMQYLTKKYLKRQQLRDFLRVVAPTKNSYTVRVVDAPLPPSPAPIPLHPWFLALRRQAKYHNPWKPHLLCWFSCCCCLHDRAAEVLPSERR